MAAGGDEQPRLVLGEDTAGGTKSGLDPRTMPPREFHAPHTAGTSLIAEGQPLLRGCATVEARNPTRGGPRSVGRSRPCSCRVSMKHFRPENRVKERPGPRIRRRRRHDAGTCRRHLVPAPWNSMIAKGIGRRLARLRSPIGRVAQRESARLTRERSQVQNLPRPPIRTARQPTTCSTQPMLEDRMSEMPVPPVPARLGGRASRRPPQDLRRGRRRRRGARRRQRRARRGRVHRDHGPIRVGEVHAAALPRRSGHARRAGRCSSATST